jgi:protein-S-isoprenylcysteine O-methyltransferase Ste14
MFDPFGWAARVVPERWLHRSIRAGAVGVFAVFFTRRLMQYDDFLLKPLWVVETIIYLVLATAFISRLDPVDRSRGVREIVVPLAGGVLPFALLTSAPHPAVWTNSVLLHGVFWWMTAATALTVWGMWVMRKTFSITVEARAVVTAGPYRWLRHPIYLGELLTAGAVMAWRFSWLNLALFALFVTIQLFRSRWEERKLARVFPAYAGWAQRAWWFWRLKSSQPA